MSPTRTNAALDRDLRFHHREWLIQRIGWVVVALFLVLALAGLFGGGPLSHARAAGASGSIEYEHFVRSGTPTDLVVTAATAGARGVNRVEIASGYLAAFRVERITPEPRAVRTMGDRLVYEFAAGAPGASISFHIHPQRLWRHRTVVRIDGGAPLEVWQLTYP
jgi:hypothetical protein